MLTNSVISAVSLSTLEDETTFLQSVKFALNLAKSQLAPSDWVSLDAMQRSIFQLWCDRQNTLLLQRDAERFGQQEGF